MRQIFEFWLGPRLLISVTEECIEDARMVAALDENVDAWKHQDEPAHEFRIRLARANVRTREIAAEGKKR